MKTYKHLWETFISEENIRKAIRKSSLGKRKRRTVKAIFDNQEESIPEIKAYAENFKNANHKPKRIYDGIVRKVRYIVVPTYKEQVIHHMVVNVLMPMFTKGMFEHSYGSVPERGGHKGKETIKKWIRKGSRNVKYCLKMDIKKYFESIPHDILKTKLARKIKDERFLAVVNEIIDVVDKGLPLGFFTSQWLANWYLQDLDHYIKEELQAIYYMRYMDDMVVFSGNKRKLHEMRVAICKYLAKLGLQMKSNWQVFRFNYNGKYRHLDFMGFRFYRSRTTLRKSILLRATRKAKRMGMKAKTTIYDCRQMLSYLGWIKATDTYGIYLERIKPYVDFGKCKKRISKYQRRINKCGIAQVMTAT